MAGTRLAAHTSFLLFTIFSIYLAWRLGAVKRTALPLAGIADLSLTKNLHPLPVHIDIVLVHHPDDCQQCSALLDAMDKPSLASAIFREDPDTVSRRVLSMLGRSWDPRRDALGFSVGDVTIRRLSTGTSAGGIPVDPPLSDPVAMDEWLLSSVLTLDGNANKVYHRNPRYSFFIGCGGSVMEGGEELGFFMGKYRHGYLGLGCNGEAVPDVETVGDDGADVSPYRRNSRLDKAATAVLQGLASLVIAYVLRSPVSLGDVHVRPGQAYRLSFTLLSEDPGLRRCTWDFTETSQRFLRPMLRKLSPFARFAVQSQELHYARLSATTAHTDRSAWKERGVYLTPMDLRGFMGANDFSILDLGSSTNATSPLSEVAVNFMVFCPSGASGPLVFREEEGGPSTEAYEVPGFGGVSVVNDLRGFSDCRGSSRHDCRGNRDGVGEVVGEGEWGIGKYRSGQQEKDMIDNVVDSLGPRDLRQSMGAHISQLRRIVGLPSPSDRPLQLPWPIEYLQPPHTSDSENHTDVKAPPSLLPLVFLPSPSDGVTDWEVDALLRAGFLYHRRAAVETLLSLAALVASRPEMEVGFKVAADVREALEELAAADIAVAGAGSARNPGTQAGGRVGGASESLDSMGTGTPVATDSVRGYEEAMQSAREAARRAEAAYFDHTMVPQLYFPLSHLLVAVYLPFLGPLAFPLLWGFVQEVRRYLQKKRRKHASKSMTGAQKEAEDKSNGTGNDQATEGIGGMSAESGCESESTFKTRLGTGETLGG
ncbi:unnamed protein product [Choristocarpus tenellus]